MSKEKVLCMMLMIINMLYALFLINEMELFVGEFHFNILYLPGILLALLIFPTANVFIWKIKERIRWIDYSFFIMPLMLWLLIIKGGSFTNFLFINFPLIWTVSLLYLFRFNHIVENKNIYILVLILWVLITIILFAVNYYIPILSE